MTPEQYKEFSKLARKQKILFSAISDKDDKGKLIDVILPETELDRANLLFERITYSVPKPEAAQRGIQDAGEGGNAIKKRYSVGTRLARYKAQSIYAAESRDFDDE